MYSQQQEQREPALRTRGIFSLAGGANVPKLGAEDVWSDGWLRKEVGGAGGRESGRSWGRGLGLVLATSLPLGGDTAPH